MDFLSYEVLLLLFTVAMIAGCIDTLAGGGGLLTIPALILSGMPPLAVLGTNKFQAVIGSMTATIVMLKKKKITISEVKWFMLYGFLGSLTGTIAIQYVNTEVLNFVIPIILVCIGFYFILMPKASKLDKEPKFPMWVYTKVVIPSIGFYDGMFGPATGSFLALGTMVCRGYELIKATAVAKGINFATNMASVVVFLVYGNIIFTVGAVMMLGQVIGAYIGGNMLFKINPNFLRIIVVCMCFGMLCKFAYEKGWISF